MTRSIVTEPLLSQVKAAKPDDRFDVIISLNELFSGGVEAAMKYVVQRAADWKVKYHELMPYLFACLTAQQILDLAQEARDLTAKNGRSGSVVYRIWEDQEINTTFTRSLSTVKGRRRAARLSSLWRRHCLGRSGFGYPGRSSAFQRHPATV